MDRLVRNHLVQRRVDDEDRRLVRHYLTASAQEMVGELERTGRERLYNIFQRLTPAQLDRLVDGLRDLAEAAEAAESAQGAEKVNAH